MVVSSVLHKCYKIILSMCSLSGISRKENLASTFFLGMFTTVTLSNSILPVVFSCFLKDQQ